MKNEQFVMVFQLLVFMACVGNNTQQKNERLKLFLSDCVPDRDLKLKLFWDIKIILLSIIKLLSCLKVKLPLKTLIGDRM